MSVQFSTSRSQSLTLERKLNKSNFRFHRAEGARERRQRKSAGGLCVEVQPSIFQIPMDSADRAFVM